jgi:hypothetical protein
MEATAASSAGGWSDFAGDRGATEQVLQTDSSVFVKLGLSDERHVHRRVVAVPAFVQDHRSARSLDG